MFNANSLFLSVIRIQGILNGTLFVNGNILIFSEAIFCTVLLFSLQSKVNLKDNQITSLPLGSYENFHMLSFFHFSLLFLEQFNVCDLSSGFIHVFLRSHACCLSTC